MVEDMMVALRRYDLSMLQSLSCSDETQLSLSGIPWTRRCSEQASSHAVV